MQNTSCICLHNVSNHACDTCLNAAAATHDRCPEAQGSAPLWLIAVILPLISTLVIVAMLAALYRTRRQKAKYEEEGSPQKVKRGTDNSAFCFDDNENLTCAACAGEENQHHPKSADEQRPSVEFHCGASLSSGQPVPSSEPECCDIDNNSGVFCSDAGSVRLSWHKSLCSTKYLKAEPQRWGDLRKLLEGSCEERAKSLKTPQSVSPLNKQLLTKIDAQQSQHISSVYGERRLHPEFLEPVQSLTFEEISKLSTPLEKTRSRHVSVTTRPATSPAVSDASFDSEAGSAAASVEVECGQFSIIRTVRDDVEEQPPPSGCSFRRRNILPVGSFPQSAAELFKACSTSSSMIEHWEDIFTMPLSFATYAPVFEDIACLPIDPSPCYDMQSDIEEII